MHRSKSMDNETGKPTEENRLETKKYCYVYPSRLKRKTSFTCMNCRKRKPICL